MIVNQYLLCYICYDTYILTYMCVYAVHDDSISNQYTIVCVYAVHDDSISNHYTFSKASYSNYAMGGEQVPSMWRSVTEDPATLDLFLDYYAASTPPLSKYALECMVHTPPSFKCSAGINEEHICNNRAIHKLNSFLRMRANILKS